MKARAAKKGRASACPNPHPGKGGAHLFTAWLDGKTVCIQCGAPEGGSK